MASCSSDEDIVSSDSEPVVIGDSEVPIQFGNISSEGISITRAGITSDNGNFTCDSVAVFAVADSIIDGSSSSIDWRKYNPDKINSADGYSVLLNNVIAKAAIETTDGTTATWLRFVDENGNNKNYFYPLNNKARYCFAAYAPRSEKDSTFFTYDQAYDSGTSGSTHQRDKIAVMLEGMDGTRDIIAACPAPGDHTKGDLRFCANYFRSNTKAELPTLKFQHMCMKFNFTMQAATDSEGKTEAGVGRMGISKIEITNVPSHISMYLIPNETPYLEMKYQNDMVSYYMKDKGDKELEPVYISDASDNAESTEKKDIGQGIYIPFLTDGESKVYTVKITVVKRKPSVTADNTSDDTDFSSTQTYTLTLNPSTSMPWAAGNCYNLNILMHASRDIEAKATLTDWTQNDWAENLEF